MRNDVIMKELSQKHLIEIKGGSTGEAICHGLAVSAGIMGVGAALNWWNPAGWVMGASAGAGLACEIYYGKDWIAA